MGKGAFVQIHNACAASFDVSYANFNCMYQHGDEGSNFAPISGSVAPGANLPSSGAQYIEAKASGSCAFDSSNFTMNIQGPGGAISLPFFENDNTWYGPGSYLVGEGLSAFVSVSSGHQYRISVSVHDHAWSNSHWMGDVAGNIGDRMIKDVVLPGTHDSGTYDITATSTIAPAQDIPSWVNAVYGLGLAGVGIASVIADWAKAQPLDILKQLNMGIRYLDLRVVYNGDDYYICHGMYSAPVNDVIAQVNTFISQNPREILILDFNHLYQMPDPATNEPLVQRMLNAFGSKMAPSIFTACSTLNDLWANGYQVIALYANADTVAQHAQLWSQDQISSPWPNTTDLGKLKSDLDTYIAQRDTSKLFVLQGILTPDGSMIGEGFIPFTSNPSSLEQLAQQVTPAVMGWVQDWSYRNLNIVIVDWFTVVPAYVDQLIRINVPS